MVSPRPPSPPALALRDELERFAKVLEGFREEAQAAASGQRPPSDAGQDELATTRSRVEVCIKAATGIRAFCDSVVDDAASQPSWQQHELRALFSIADACSLAQCDLRPLVSHLEQARQSDAHRDLLEAARRKVRRACNRVLAVLGPLVGRTLNDATLSQNVLETSLAVRRHYTRFRRALPLVDTSPQSVRRALSATLDLVANVMRHVDASDIRIQDEMVFKSLQNRTETWLTKAQSPESGRQLFTDVCTFAGELRRVNERRELRAHDAWHVDGALTVLDAPTPNVDALVGPMKALEGLDDELDRLFGAVTREGVPAAVLGLRERLRALRPQMAPSPPAETRSPR